MSKLTKPPLLQRAEHMLNVAEFIARERLAEERDLFATKWFDYRFLRPEEATLHFAKVYQDLFKDYWRANFDMTESEKKLGLPKSGVMTNRREFASLWYARQVADALGVPYDFYIRRVLDLHLASKWKHLPRPNQLCSKKWRPVIREHVQEKWAEWCRDARLMHSGLAQYRDEHFRGLPAQIAHRDWVVRQIKLRGAWPHLIGRACFIERILPEEQAIAEFGEEAVERARSEVTGDTPAAVEELSDNAFWPSCYIVPHAHDADSPICQACPYRKPCSTGEAKIREVLHHRHGSDDPVRVHKLAMNRERVRKHRAERAARRAAANGGDADPGRP